MKRITMVIVSIMMLISCGSEIDKKIPDSMLVGAVPNMNISLEEDNYRGGKAIIATGIVPFDIKREQVKPSLLAILRVAAEKYPKATGIFVRLTPDEQLGRFAYFAGKADYEDNVITVHYGVPSDEQIKKWNSEIGKPITFEESTLGINDSPQLSRFNKETFDSGKKIILLFHKIEKQLYDKYINQPLKSPTTEQISRIAAKELGLSLKEVTHHHRLLSNYFSAGTGIWGKETINLK